ncbi:uncharacterized protein TNCV_1896471 [Trichonephila clavipes]|nr:uncharacterized protein TNCV_1896471 [Trichonephila clavipes]
MDIRYIKQKSGISQAIGPIAMNLGCGSSVVKITDHGRYAMSSSVVPLKTHRVGERCTLNLSRVQTSSRWCGVMVRGRRCQLRCCPRHLTMVQNDEVRPPSLRVAEQ